MKLVEHIKNRVNKLEIELENLKQFIGWIEREKHSVNENYYVVPTIPYKYRSIYKTCYTKDIIVFCYSVKINQKTYRRLYIDVELLKRYFIKKQKQIKNHKRLIKYLQQGKQIKTTDTIYKLYHNYLYNLKKRNKNEKQS